MRTSHVRHVVKMIMRTCLCTVMDAKSSGTHIASIFKRYPMDIGSATIVVHSENLTHANNILVGQGGSHADGLEANSAGSVAMIRAGIKSGSLFGHGSIWTLISRMKRTTHQPRI